MDVQNGYRGKVEIRGLGRLKIKDPSQSNVCYRAVGTDNGDGSRTYFEISLRDAWVWDMYRPVRFVSSVRVVTFKDVNVEELPGKDL